MHYCKFTTERPAIYPALNHILVIFSCNHLILKNLCTSVCFAYVILKKSFNFQFNKCHWNVLTFKYYFSSASPFKSFLHLSPSPSGTITHSHLSLGNAAAGLLTDTMCDKLHRNSLCVYWFICSFHPFFMQQVLVMEDTGLAFVFLLVLICYVNVFYWNRAYKLWLNWHYCTFCSMCLGQYSESI